MKIFVSAAEISSDIHAEAIIKALQASQVEGIGGPRLRSIPNFKCIEPAENLRAMGFVEVLGKLKQIKKTLDRTLEAIEKFQPDLIITFDYPDFHLRLMKKLKDRGIAKNALKVCAIPPKVWVWRSQRVEKIRSLYDGVVVVFPFEKTFYESHHIPVIYEGNPLIADLISRAAVFRTPEKKDFSIAVMPGSREAELKYHLPIIQKTLPLIAQKLGKPIRALVPVPAGVSFPVLQNTTAVTYELKSDGAAECLAQCEVGLIKSGTSTLEAAVLGCVPVIFYKANWISEWIFRLVVRYEGPIGLPNILLGSKNRKTAPFPEYLGPEATPEALAEAVLNAFHSKKSAQDLVSTLVPSPFPAIEIAKKIKEWLEVRPLALQSRHSKKFYIRLVSTLWSTVNLVRRRFYHLMNSFFPGFIYQVPVPSVLVGNLQAGGAGKTPLLLELAQYLISKGKRVAVVSRGYGGSKENEVSIISGSTLSMDPKIYGDEPALLKSKIPALMMAIGSDRTQAVKLLLAQEKPDIVLFDDGFQNLKFKTTQTVLCVTDRTACEVFYRDFQSEQKWADLIVQTKGNQPFSSDPSLLFLEWQSENLPKIPIWILCAVADPNEVVSYYQQQGVKIKKLIAKPDHATFDSEEVKNLMKQAQAAGAGLAVTEKDAVKLASYPELLTHLLILSRKIKGTQVFDQILKNIGLN